MAPQDHTSPPFEAPLVAAPKKRRRRHRWGRLVIPLLLLLVLLAGKLVQPQPVLQIQRAAGDLLQHLHPRPYSADLPLRVVEIDDESLARYGQWPWPRSLLAELVERLRAGGAALVVFDVLFAEPDRASPGRLLDRLGLTATLRDAGIDPARLPDGDAMLAQAIAAQPTVLGFALSDEAGAGAPPPHPSFGWGGADPRPSLPAYRGAVRDLPQLEAAAAGYGSLNGLTDSDGVDRRVPLVFSAFGQIYPSLVAEALRLIGGERSYQLKAVGSSGESRFGSETGMIALRAGTRPDAIAVPTDAAGALVLHLTRPGAPRGLPAWQLLDGSVAGDAVDGKLVLVALSAKGFGDLRPTSGGPRSSHELHAQAIEQVLVGDFLTRPDWADGAELLVSLVLGGTLILLVPLLRPIWSAAFAALLIVLLLAASWAAFVALGLALDAIYPSLVVAILFVASTVATFFHADRDRAFIRHAFTRYLSPELVAELADNPDQLRLGGERRALTFLFTDIADFTSLSERLGPVALAPIMNRYFDGACAVIFRHGGMVNEFIGDAILAFFGAPVAQPDHAARALACVRELDAYARRFAAERQAEGIPFGRTRIGLHTGTAMVGNFGSSQRFKYSALGDVVNTASRIEGLNKYFGTTAALSGVTAAASGGDSGLRLLGRIVVKGKTEALAIYEIPPPDMGSDFLARYRAAYTAMAAGEDARAATLFRALQAEKPDDGPSAFHLRRLEQGESGDLIVMSEK